MLRLGCCLPSPLLKFLATLLVLNKFATFAFAAVTSLHGSSELQQKIRQVCLLQYFLG